MILTGLAVQRREVCATTNILVDMNSMFLNYKDLNLKWEAERGVDLDNCVNCFGQLNLIQGYFTEIRSLK